MPTDFQQFLRSRRSIRRFKPDAIPDSVIEKILTTALHSPSAHNLQHWRFCVIREAKNKAKLGEALTNKMRIDMLYEGALPEDIETRAQQSIQRIQQAPVIILLCKDATIIRKFELEEITMAIQSVALAGMQLLLAAHAENLGANWVCWPLYAPNAVQETLDLPRHWEPQAMIFIGVPDQLPNEKQLTTIQEAVLWR